MRKLKLPSDISEEVFLECIQIIKNRDLRTRLTAIKTLIKEADEEFRGKVTTGQLHTIARESLINEDVTSKELQDVYTLRMARKGTAGRNIYDRIIITSQHNICPLCAQREVTQIDHYMPKAHYPRLSVVPVNLLPSCSDCNKSKLERFPTIPREEIIHPYFDDIENVSWLFASIDHSTPPTFKFQVIIPDSWDSLLGERVQFHFESLSLNKLYSTHAAVELCQINKYLKIIHEKYAAEGVKKNLLNGSASRKEANLNSWQAAMYSAMANDDWFCDGGFSLE